MSLEGNVCYLIVYHYKSNAILGLPISGFDDNTVFAAYKTQFEFLESKGYKIKLNVMDNQCMKQIKKILTDNDCKLMLIEPHNHHVNAAERAIQTFKIILSVPSRRPTAKSPFNYGTSSHRTLRLLSI